jgi:ubiquinone/menaquinone biosynthesis C-methylase UbiE
MDNEASGKMTKITLKSIRHTYDEIAAEFDITRYKPWPQTVDFISGVADNCSILDLGCGNGRNIVYLVSLDRGFEIVGLDFSSRMLRLAGDKFKSFSTGNNVKLVSGDIVKLPFAKGAFDSILFVATLHHLPSAELRLKSVLEMERCLKHGGKAFIGVWDFEQERFAAELEAQLKIPPPDREFGDVLVPWSGKRSSAQQRFYHLFYRDELEQLLKQTRLKIIDIFRASDNYHAVVQKLDEP